MRKNLQAEQAIIGDILLKSSEVLPEAALQLAPEDFNTLEFQNIFRACLKLYRENRPIDEVTILAAVGNEYREAILTAAAATPSISNFGEYIRIVKETAQINRATEYAAELIDLANNSASLEECRDAAVSALQSFDSRTVQQEVSAQEGLLHFFDTKEKPKEYITTGFDRLDNSTFLDRGDYMVIGGRPSAGKTALTLQIMLHMAKKYRVVYFSLETKSDKIFDRLIACYTGTNITAIKRSDISEDGWTTIVEHSDSFMKLCFNVVPASGWTVEQIKSKAIQLQADVIFIDYLGLVCGKGKDLYERTTRISADFHVMAQQTGITVVALSQMNRNGADNPDMTSLRDSGAIEQDADIILLLVNPDGNKDCGRRNLLCRKNKEGRCGKVPLSFDGQHQVFRVIDDRYGEGE